MNECFIICPNWEYQPSNVPFFPCFYFLRKRHILRKIVGESPRFYIHGDLLKRLTADVIYAFYNNVFNKDIEFYKQYEEVEEFNQSITSKFNIDIVSSPYT